MNILNTSRVPQEIFEQSCSNSFLMLMNEKNMRDPHIPPVHLTFKTAVRIGILEIYANLFNFQTHNGTMINDVKASYWI